MTNKLLPLNYAIMKLFLDGRVRCAKGVISELSSDYSGYKMLTLGDVDETLATAKENGLLDEVGVELEGKDLKISYRLNEYGRDLIQRYIK